MSPPRPPRDSRSVLPGPSRTGDALSRRGSLQFLRSHRSSEKDCGSGQFSGAPTVAFLCFMAGIKERSIMDYGLKGESIVCFAGEDWWYHHPHSKNHILRRLARDNKVLFVNS